jgi:XTP/dITP diphosphohydrolase
VERVRAILASKNQGKLRELRAALPGWELEPLDADDYPPETADTYYENARRKAEFGRSLRLAEWVLGEDSGLEVEGLAGRPGVRSARYAEPGEDPVAKLLDELDGVGGQGRRGRYVCELVCLSPKQDEFRGVGVLEGTIAERPRGSEGFGFDPVFVPEGKTRTVAELGDAWKRANSHRARAAEALRKALGPTVERV